MMPPHLHPHPHPHPHPGAPDVMPIHFFANPLWFPENETVDSSAFIVYPGKAVSLFAIGLERFKVKQDSQTATTQQAICVGRIVRDFVPPDKPRAVGPPVSACDCFIVDAPWNEVELVEELVTTPGECPWQLTQCNNFRIIGIPGIYRLHLNDDTAIGKVQVYAEQYDLWMLPPCTPNIFFG